MATNFDSMFWIYLLVAAMVAGGVTLVIVGWQRVFPTAPAGGGAVPAAQRRWWFGIVGGALLAVVGLAWISSLIYWLAWLTVLGLGIALIIFASTRVRANRIWVIGIVVGSVVALAAVLMLVPTVAAVAQGISLPSLTYPGAGTGSKAVTLPEAEAACGSRGLLSYDPKTGAFVCATVSVSGGGDSAPVGGAVGEAVPAGTGCVTADWFRITTENTQTVSELLSDLDREFNRKQGNIGGAWTQEMAESKDGFTVPTGSIFWTDMFDNIKSLPAGVKSVRTQGGWGIYTTSVAYKILLPNGGGRYANLCGETTQVSELPSQGACLSQADLNNITGSENPVDEYNAYFETAGYAYGTSLEPGDTAKAGGIFLGTFDQNAIPASATNLADGFIWELSQDVVAPNGGRWITACASR